MSLWRRLRRAYETRFQFHLSGQVAFGEQGEEEAARVLAQAGVACCVRNPLIAAPEPTSYPYESDFLVYTQGTLFCVEIKNYKGYLRYERNEDDGKRVLIREKTGKYGESLAPQVYRDPLRQVGTFIHHLKNTLVSMDGRFRGLHIIGVVAFSAEGDISAIHSFAGGLITIAELPAFFRSHAHPTFASKPPSRWIVEALQRLPTADVIVNVDNERFKGFLLDQEVRFRDIQGQTHHLPYKHIRNVRLQRSGLFSAYDALAVQDTDGQVLSFHCIDGSFRFLTFDGKEQVHRLRNVNLVLVGNANKR